MKHDIEYNPPEWAPYAVPSAAGWRHPVTRELLVSVPGGIKQKEPVDVEETPIINEAPAVEPVVNEAPAVEPVVNEAPAAEPVIDEAPAAEPVIEKTPVVETPKVVEKTPATKPPAKKRGPKPKVK